MTRATMNASTLPSSAAPGFRRLQMTRATINTFNKQIFEVLVVDCFLELLEGSAARVGLGEDSLVHLVLHVSPKGRPGVGRRWQMTMDKIIISTFTIWQMTMGKISTFTISNFTFPSYAATNASSATSCVKLFSCDLHVTSKGRYGGTRVSALAALR